MTKTIDKEVKMIGKKVEFPIYLADEVRTKLINLDSKNYNIKKTTLILTYCKIVSYRLPKKETVSIDMEKIANDIGSTRQYVSNCVDVLIEEGILASVKNGTIGASSVYGFPLEPNQGYSCMKFNDYKKKEEDIKLVDSLNKLSPGAKALYCMMKNTKDFSILSTRSGENYLGVSCMMISRYLKELEESGMIFSDGQKRYFPQEFDYEIDDKKVDVSKENNIEVRKLEICLIDAKDKYQELKNENEELNKEIRRLQNSSEAEEIKKLKREISRLTSELEKERKPSKVVCKGYTKKEAEIYIEELEEQVEILQDEASKSSGFKNQKEYDDYLLLQQSFHRLNDINASMAFELKLYNDKYGPIICSNVEKTEAIETESGSNIENENMEYDENNW